ncbi:MAG TPA: AAA family ATPase [Acidimicrobiales bacterium]|nr:AAA family ATPase [Acidimicrobiales bacterium]
MIARKVLVVSRATALAKEVQAAAGSGCIVTHYPYVGDIEEYVDLKGPFDMLVAGPLFDTKAGMERLRRLREANNELPVLLALESPVRSALPEVIRVGASDLVELPADRRRLAAAVKRTLESKRSAEAEPETDEEWETPLAEVISIASPSGGCGKTFYSTNLCHFLARTTGKRVCLVDLDLQFGEVMTALRLKPRYTMVDAVVRSDDEASALDTYIEEYLVHHESGFAVLPAPRHPAEADRISMPDITRIVTALRRHFDYVIVDTSAQLSEVTLTALEQSTALIAMATVDLPSIRNMRVFLDTLERLNIPTDNITVILNKVEPDMGIQLEEVNEALHNKVVSVLPYAREVSRSINQGQPVLVTDPRSDISRRLAAGMQMRVGGAPDGLAGAPGAETDSKWRRTRSQTVPPTVQSDEGPARASRLLLKVLKRKEEGK